MYSIYKSWGNTELVTKLSEINQLTEYLKFAIKDAKTIRKKTSDASIQELTRFIELDINKVLEALKY